ncbi:MAG: ATP-binding protein [Termitinemataceae bacterium]|nr:MAG: ATP-binding protein [Termitinemataceae bacterium]
MGGRSININAHIQSLDVVLSFINDALNAVFCPQKEKQQIELAVEELFVNISNYAYGGESGKTEINISERKNIDSSVTELLIEFTDTGKQFNPLQHKDPDITLPLEEREPGGLGLFLVKRSMDDVKYEYTDGYNKTTIVKIWKKDKRDQAAGRT